jgi:protein O-GlcNAc transferase
MTTIAESFATAIGHHQAGRLQIAEPIYRSILAADPNHADALHLLGLIQHQRGDHDRAIEYLQRAIGLQGQQAIYHSNLGEAYRALRRFREAISCYRRALDIDPAFAGVYYNLGNALKDDGQLTEAIEAYQRALQLNPNDAKANNNLGNVLRTQDEFAEAARCYRRAVQLSPNYAEAHNNLGLALTELKQNGEAVLCFQRALQLKPNFAEVHNNLGNLFKRQKELDQAAACYRRALELKPDLAEAHTNIGIVLNDQGELDQALASFRRGLELKPEDAAKHSNLLYTLHYCADCDAETLYEEHRRWNQQRAEPLASLIRPHTNERSTDRRLRIGYVSPDFTVHPVGRFILPLLEAHDHQQFEVFCYASQTVCDTYTSRCREQADTWRYVASLSDDQLAEMIRQDQIDILVDLAMHTSDNRLLVFARKPAPVQATYLAYCGTTSLSTMDYRLTAPHVDPPGHAERFYSEQSICLPETFWCYQPLAESPAVNELPALQAGHITFGCLNNFCKITYPTRTLWSRLLQELPTSRLILHAPDGSHRDRVRDYFARRNVSPERLSFVSRAPLADYLGNYAKIDVALDPFPYGGGATTCDALWMGVPVVSLAGQTAVGRAGLSILSNVRLSELVVCDLEQYLQIAATLAADLPRLSALRKTLRGRMQASPLTDAPRFARNIESAYRVMWQRWCNN